MEARARVALVFALGRLSARTSGQGDDAQQYHGVGRCGGDQGVEGPVSWLGRTGVKPVQVVEPSWGTVLVRLVAALVLVVAPGSTEHGR